MDRSYGAGDSGDTIVGLVFRGLSGPIKPEYLAQFKREQQCSIGFAGLRPIWRMFV